LPEGIVQMAIRLQAEPESLFERSCPLLRLSGERHHEGTSRRGQQEAAVHYSMT
jgi:hypothetical protein